MGIEIRGLSKRFGGTEVLKNIGLTVPSGELVALLGPSGSGKTTLLRIIAGLESHDAGELLFSGEDASRRPAADRGVGFVFQHYALFRHMTVFDNVAFGLEVKPRAVRPNKAAIKKKVEELLTLVQMEMYAGRYPAQLSGGQRQRVALARALAVEPKVLLLDEPFGALDARVRKDLRRWLRQLHDEIHVTSVFVTHDQEEALEVADRIVVMRDGVVEQQGTPDEVYHHPANPFVYEFLGSVNLFHGRVEDNRLHIGDVSLELAPGAGHGGENAVAYIRPHQWEIHNAPDAKGRIPAIIKDVNFAGPVVKIELVTSWNEQVQVELPRAEALPLQLEKGNRAYLAPKELKLFSPER